MGPDLPALIPLSILAIYLLLIRINYVFARNKRRDAQLAGLSSASTRGGNDGEADFTL